jgi:hypothetical protein
MSFLSQYNQVLKKEGAPHSKPQFHFNIISAAGLPPISKVNGSHTYNN